MQKHGFVQTYPPTIELDAKTAVKMYDALILSINKGMAPLAWSRHDSVLEYCPCGYPYIKMLLQQFFPNPHAAGDLCEAIHKLGIAAEDQKPVTLTLHEYNAAYYPGQSLSMLSEDVKQRVSEPELLSLVKDTLQTQNPYLLSKVTDYATVGGVSFALNNLATTMGEAHTLATTVRPAIEKAMAAATNQVSASYRS